MFRIPLSQSNQFFGQALRFFGLGPCRGDGFMFDEGCNEVSQEGLSVRGTSAKMTVFGCASSHCDAIFEVLW
jgi:hypothetical protein